MDSMLGLIETITSAIVDHFTHLRSKLWAVVIGTCTVGFLFGLTLCTSGGIDVLGKGTRILGCLKIYKTHNIPNYGASFNFNALVH